MFVQDCSLIRTSTFQTNDCMRTLDMCDVEGMLTMGFIQALFN